MIAFRQKLPSQSPPEGWSFFERRRGSGGKYKAEAASLPMPAKKKIKVEANVFSRWGKCHDRPMFAVSPHPRGRRVSPALAWGAGRRKSRGVLFALRQGKTGQDPGGGVCPELGNGDAAQGREFIARLDDSHAGSRNAANPPGKTGEASGKGRGRLAPSPFFVVEKARELRGHDV